MKRIFLIILLFINIYLSGQVVTTKIIYTTLPSNTFNTGVALGTTIIDMSTQNEYLALIPLPPTKSINTCVLGVDIQQTSGVITPPASFEKEITMDGENNITVPFILKSTSLISYNGSIIGLARWQGIGTNTLTLNLDIKKNDKITIKN